MDVPGILWVFVLTLCGIGFNIDLVTPLERKRFVGCCAAIGGITAYLYSRHIDIASWDCSVWGPAALAGGISAHLFLGTLFTDHITDWRHPVLLLTSILCSCEAITTQHLSVLMGAMVFQFLLCTTGGWRKFVRNGLFCLPALLGSILVWCAIGSDLFSDIQGYLFSSHHTLPIAKACLFFTLLFIALYPAFIPPPTSWFSLITFFHSLCAWFLLCRLHTFFGSYPSLLPILAVGLLALGVLRLYGEREVLPLKNGLTMHMAVLLYALSLRPSFLSLYATSLLGLYAFTYSCRLFYPKKSVLPMTGMWSLSLLPGSLAFLTMLYALYTVIGAGNMGGIVFLFSAYWVLVTGWLSFITPTLVRALADPVH